MPFLRSQCRAKNLCWRLAENCMLTRRYSKYFTNSEVIRCKNTIMVLSRVCATWHFKLPSWSKAVVRFSPL